MDKLVKLFTFLQITRNQPQYGYSLVGIPKSELSDLAQHHYLVAMIALQLGHYFNSNGAKVNIQKILEIALTHDLGEVFGGDINYYYSRAKPVAREKAKEFEAENLKYIAELFQGYGKEILENSQDFENKNSDEAVVAQFADKIECIHYKSHLGVSTEGEIPATQQSLRKTASKAQDPQLKKLLEEFADVWGKSMPGKKFLDILASEVKEYN